MAGGAVPLVNVCNIEVTGVTWTVAPVISVGSGVITGNPHVYVVSEGTTSGEVFEGAKLIVPVLQIETVLLAILIPWLTVTTKLKVVVQVPE